MCFCSWVCLPHPETIEECCQNPKKPVFCHGVAIVKKSPEVVTKFGAHIHRG